MRKLWDDLKVCNFWNYP